MRKTILIAFGGLLSFSLPGLSQEKKPGLIPAVEISYQLGLCGETNPVSVLAGVQQPFRKHLSFVYDIHYWSTAYEVYCCDTYSKGHYTTVTPSVKFIYNTGKQTGKGFFAGAGIGYMFAKDRGTEQSYTKDPGTGQIVLGKDITSSNYDFHSIAPSFIWGIGLRVCGFPVSVINTNYFAKTSVGWMAAATGVGIKFGFGRPGNCK